jgi:hypothetical protein
MVDKETIEKVAESRRKEKYTDGSISNWTKNDWQSCYKEGFIDGTKFQAQRMYSDMQEYAEFCIECDRKEMPLLLVQDWYEHYKNQNNEQ